MNQKQFLSLLISLFLCFAMLSGAIIYHTYSTRKFLLTAVSDLSIAMTHNLDAEISPVASELNRIDHSLRSLAQTIEGKER
ncbi:MAG: hypothetical protein KHW93_01195 [Butyricicoccus pullicaecorum]|nr:hypothetical protein [Butyricicoccus pullicaecorum]